MIPERIHSYTNKLHLVEIIGHGYKFLLFFSIHLLTWQRVSIHCLDFRVKHWDGCESPHPTSDGKSESFPRIGSFEQLMERFEN